MAEQSVTRSAPESGPPMPKWAYTIVNPAMVTLLRSPLHRLLSQALMILIFEGRRSGKRYTIPVGYLREGNRLYLFSHSAWSNNFVGGAPVAVRLRGKLRRGMARIIDDPATINHVIRRMVSVRGEAMAQRMGFVTRGTNGTTELRIPQGTTFIEIALDDLPA